MAMFGKKAKQADKAAPKAVAKGASSKQPKPAKPSAPPDIYTLLLGLAALFLITATIVLVFNYTWYQSVEPAVIPLNWAK